MTLRLTSRSLAGTLRNVVAVGTVRLFSMLVAIAAAAPLIGLPASSPFPAAGAAGLGAGAGAAAGAAGVALTVAGAGAATGAGAAAEAAVDVAEAATGSGAGADWDGTTELTGGAVSVTRLGVAAGAAATPAGWA